MGNGIIAEIIEKVDLLTTEEQLRLISVLTEKAGASTAIQSGSLRTWSDLKGALSYPACGEDAQTCISDSRREADRTRFTDSNR